MSTHKTDTSTNAYDPGSMNTFGKMSGALGQTLPGFMTNPFGSQQFGLEQQMGTRQAQNMGQSQMSGLLQNMTGSGMAGGASNPAGTEMMQNQARANTGMQAQLGFMQPTQNALQRQQFAMGLGSQYRPLQTGQTQQETTGGLGTWLPQLIGAAAGMATGGMGGMMGGGISPLMSMFGGGGNLMGGAGAGGYGGGFGGAGGSNWMGSGPGGGYDPGGITSGSPFGGQWAPPAPPGPGH